MSDLKSESYKFELKFTDFINKNNTLIDLLHNSRRSGATDIIVVTDEEKRTITIVDNGSGIKDIKNLFTLDDDGVSIKVSSIHIISDGKRVLFDTEEILKGKSIGYRYYRHNYSYTIQ